jgi:cytoskeletal protein CcmA (bactofilin family)
MPSRSEGLLGVTVFGLIAAVPLLVAGLRVGGVVIVPEDQVVREDLYAIGERVIVEGVVEGDLFVITGHLTVAGRVEGDVSGLVGGPATISGEVNGSVRIAAANISITGHVRDDLAAASTEISINGSVGRDALLFSGEVSSNGVVGRDIRAQAFRMWINGSVGKDVKVRVDTLILGDSAVVVGDVFYKASDDAEVAPGALVNGGFIRRDALAPVWAKAVTRVFAILSVFGFILAGLIGQWLFRGTSRRAEAVVGTRPGQAALVGLGAVLVAPILILPLFLSLVGIPVALVLLLVWLVALFLGPLPAITWVGRKVVSGQGGMALGLVVGTILWRGAMWLLPLLAALLYLAALLLGLGAAVLAAWEQRGREGAGLVSQVG